ncbi:MAG: preprotein translocase subunit SecY [Pseudanabaenaceae cyanobacterium SKYGB_i_bin29]|nr:preprotein translocase subunit SecY [Pseudanabaenaceae cyanobacterium SKYG29]MDW8422185.1 preprotein translocase subunit SecY [Pseudanabaenaceae cyanobacterium SKYGB_i_bin29]
MTSNRSKDPTSQEIFMQMAQASGLRDRLLVTIGILILVRLGNFVPVPGIDRSVLANIIQGSPLANFIDAFSGGGLSLLGVFALGILPFINASIFMQIFITLSPTLENLQKNEGEAGRRTIAQYTRYWALIIAIIQSLGTALFLQGGNAVKDMGVPFFQIGEVTISSFTLSCVVALTAGAMFVMWLGELITERGIGNGASLLIFVGIAAGLPRSFGSTIQAVTEDPSLTGGFILLLVTFLAMIVAIVFVQEGTRRIPIVYAKRQVGRKLYREMSSYLPLRLNQGGVMPIIFASSFFLIPALLAESVNNPGFTVFVNNFLRQDSIGYIILYPLLILAFSYFYSSIIINPVELSQNLKKMGASVPGKRPGAATTEYLEGVLNRLTFLGAIFLSVVVLVPLMVQKLSGNLAQSSFGATSLLILVGVAIETANQIRTYVISQRYEGMVKQ